MSDFNQRTFVKSHAQEGFKSHYEYDGDGRLTATYDAAPGCLDGGPCLVTEYQYAIVGSDRITGRKETVGEWDSSWDF